MKIAIHEESGQIEEFEGKSFIGVMIMIDDEKSPVQAMDFYEIGRLSPGDYMSSIVAMISKAAESLADRGMPKDEALRFLQLPILEGLANAQQVFDERDDKKTGELVDLFKKRAKKDKK